MANCCGYEIHVRGNKKAALFLFAMMPVCDSKEIIHEEGTDDEYVVWIKGDCNWGLDYNCTEKTDVSINLNTLGIWQQWRNTATLQLTPVLSIVLPITLQKVQMTRLIPQNFVELAMLAM